jgi:anti-sigma regulatory factor (Ser/Thr protein kinase)
MSQAQARTWHVPPRREAVGETRHDVRKTLAGWGLAEAIDDTELIVSELLTNALRHGAPAITLSLTVDDAGRLAGAVTDQGARRPYLRPTGEVEESGRGLSLVDAIARAWGVEPHPGGGQGKSVWWSWQRSREES